MKLIELHSKKYPNLFVQVDDEDYEWLNEYRWNAFIGNHRGSFYARTSLSYQTPIFMHRMILLNCKQVDHIDRNGLNNQRNNLRPADNTLNLANTGKQKGVWTSKYKGVHWFKRTKKWRATISNHRKRISLGYFDFEIDAAKAYDKKAKELFGEYAYLNFA